MKEIERNESFWWFMRGGGRERERERERQKCIVD
jgi:hypothetical protein